MNLAQAIDENKTHLVFNVENVRPQALAWKNAEPQAERKCKHSVEQPLLNVGAGTWRVRGIGYAASAVTTTNTANPKKQNKHHHQNPTSSCFRSAAWAGWEVCVGGTGREKMGMEHML
tara:strand:- start:979 stop:1332 length:354 start_codon:yes stop_codon:yes gene_type:complete